MNDNLDHAVLENPMTGRPYGFPDYENHAVICHMDKERERFNPETDIHLDDATKAFALCVGIQTQMIKRDFIRQAIMQRTCGDSAVEYKPHIPPTFSEEFQEYMDTYMKGDQYLLHLCNELKDIEKDEETLCDHFLQAFGYIAACKFHNTKRETIIRKTFYMIHRKAFMEFTKSIALITCKNDQVNSIGHQGEHEGFDIGGLCEFKKAFALSAFGITLHFTNDCLILLFKPKTEPVCQAGETLHFKF